MPMLQAFTASFIMPMFVIIAGYCGHKSLSKISTLKDLFDYNFKNFKRLYVPSVSVATVMWLLKFEHFSSLGSIMGGFWFLTMLFVVMALTSVVWYSLSLVPSLKGNKLIEKIAPPHFALDSHLGKTITHWRNDAFLPPRSLS